jgi:hypothetical protein
VTKATNCILAASARELTPEQAVCPAFAAAPAWRFARRICCRSSCTGMPAPRSSTRRRIIICSVASSAAVAATSAPAISRWCSITATPRTKSGRRRKKSSRPNWPGSGIRRGWSGWSASKQEREAKLRQKAPSRADPVLVTPMIGSRATGTSSG